MLGSRLSNELNVRSEGWEIEPGFRQMLSDDDLFNLPEDPERAFYEIEKRLRKKLEERLDSGHNDSPYDEWYTDYINETLGAASALEIEYFENFSVPASRRNVYDEYRRFRLGVDHYLMNIRIKHSRRAKKYSVQLDFASRQKIRHHLTQLKEFIDKLEISKQKRESIFARISDLESEIERDRTRLEVVGDFLIECANIGNETGEKMEPWRRWLESIAKIVGTSKEDESAHLPAPQERKKIEPPKQKKDQPPPTVNDDIPF